MVLVRLVCGDAVLAVEYDGVLAALATPQHAQYAWIVRRGTRIAMSSAAPDALGGARSDL